LISYYQTFSNGVSTIDKLKRVLKENTLVQANWALTQGPITITASFSQRSAGSKHDFFSEGDYWWPNPNDSNGSYILKDGLTNPNNFTQHRKAMIRFSQIIGSLASAYIITKDEKYVVHAFKHLNAWFIDTATLMNPSLLYAQAIKGKATGRSIGIIDMIQMLEVAQGMYTMQNAAIVNKTELQKLKGWFSNYLNWVTTHPYGIEERDAKNNHGTCWVMQVAVFAKLVGNNSLLEDCKNRFKTILLPNQMDSVGRFTLEIKRTKPYGYSLFNLDAMTTICHVISNKEENLWDFSLQDGRTLKKGVEFMYPYVENKETWLYQKDVMYWNEWPIAQPFLAFAYKKYGNINWFNTWKRLNHFPTNEEVIRNLPIRNPLIWLAS
jgi:hypothetical protein